MVTCSAAPVVAGIAVVEAIDAADAQPAFAIAPGPQAVERNGIVEEQKAGGGGTRGEWRRWPLRAL